MNKLKKLLNVLYVWTLKRKADRLAKKSSVQYFVIRFGGKITLLNKSSFKEMRQHGIFKKTFTADNLKKIALYYTK